MSQDNFFINQPGSGGGSGGGGYAAAGEPGANNDDSDSAGIGQTFDRGSIWINTNDNVAWVCVDASTGAAKWAPLTRCSVKTILDGATFPIVAGAKGDFILDGPGVILGYRILNNSRTDNTDTISVDLWKCTWAQYDSGATHPVVGDSIVAAAPISIPAGASNYKNSDFTLTGWTKTFAVDDVFRWVVSAGVVNITRASVQLVYVKIK